MRKKIVILISIFILVFIYFKDFGNYELAGISKSFAVNENNKVDNLLVEDNYLSIYLDPQLNREYILEKIEIIYHNKKLGEILVNKNLDNLQCFEKKRFCTYEISEEELKKILDKKKIYKKIRTRFYEYDRNYFEFKIFIKNKKLKNQKTEFIIDKIGIRFKRWYDIEIPYYWESIHKRVWKWNNIVFRNSIRRENEK
mgnify:CR=1 FL=1